ncbi:protein Red-like [Ctenodactylus gundi]
MLKQAPKRASELWTSGGHSGRGPHSCGQPQSPWEDFRQPVQAARPQPASACPPPSRERLHWVRGGGLKSEGPSERGKKEASRPSKCPLLEIQTEGAQEYQDRAQKRRERDKVASETALPDRMATHYRALAPMTKAARNNLIWESMFLGGDRETAPLVKGLDFALLHKTRAEIESKEKEKKRLELEKECALEPCGNPRFKTHLGRSIYRVLFETKAPKWHELFLPGRMTYVVDLSDSAPTDIPITVKRSRAHGWPTEATLTASDAVVRKITDLFLGIRQGAHKKLKKSDTGMPRVPKGKDKENLSKANMDIFEGVGDYAPFVTKIPPPREVYRDQEQKYKQNDRAESGKHKWQQNLEAGQGSKGHSYFKKPKMGSELQGSHKGLGFPKELNKSIHEKLAPSAGLGGVGLLKIPERQKTTG